MSQAIPSHLISQMPIANVERSIKYQYTVLYECKEIVTSQQFNTR